MLKLPGSGQPRNAALDVVEIHRSKADMIRGRALITGGGGFIASHLAERLVTEYSDVRAMVRYNSSLGIGNLANLAPEVRKAIEIVKGDLRDLSSVEQCIRGCDVVFHLGALVSVPYSYEAPLAFLEVNNIGTGNVLDASRRAAVRRILVMSSSEVYGCARYVPIDESHPLRAQSPYAASKIAAEKLAESFHCTYQLPVTAVRSFNVFGPRQSTRALIPSILEQALRGSRVRIGNPYPIRDFTFVADLIQALVCLSECDSSLGLAVNVGTGCGVAIPQIIEMVGALMGKRLVTELESKRQRPEKSEVDRLIADATLLRRLTGWQPSVEFAAGLELVYRSMEHLPRRDDAFDI